MRPERHGDWQTITVGELIEAGRLVIGDGYRAKNVELGEVGIPFARAGNVRAGFAFDGADRLLPERMVYVGRKVSRPGDVVFTSKGTVGRFGLVISTTPEFVYSPQLCFWRVQSGCEIDPRFLYFWMHGDECHRQFNALKGQTDMADYVSLRDQHAIELTLPLPIEQKAIASVLATLDGKIDSNRRFAALLEEVAETVFRGRFVEFIGVDELEESEIGPIPRGWEVVAFSDAVTINPRVTVKKGSSVPFIEMAGVDPWSTRPTVIGRRVYAGGARFEPGDTLMARITGCIEHGKGAFVDFIDTAGAGSTEFLVLRARPPLTPEAVFLLSRTERVRNHAIASMTGSSGRQRVVAAALADLKLAVPPDMDSWADDASLMREVMSKTRAIWRESRTLRELRDALLPKLISGEIRVPDTTDPEEVIGLAAEQLAEARR